MGGNKIIAIDGTAASGKSTVAREVSRRLSCRLLDTGAMYRAVTLISIERNIDVGDHQGLKRLAREVSQSLSFQEDKDGELRVLLAGRDISISVRSPEVGARVSEVSAVPEVREVMVGFQRELLEQGGAVMEGRDIGTKVCAGADIKLYLDASMDERVKRRQLQLAGQGMSLDTAQVRNGIAHRDRFNSTREHSPLVPAADSIRIDTTGMTVEEVVAEVMRIIEEVD